MTDRGRAAMSGEGALSDYEQRGINVLRTEQRQLDSDGIEVGVSREALDVALAIIDRLQAADSGVASNRDVIEQIAAVCADNASPTCRHDMALNFIADVCKHALADRLKRADSGATSRAGYELAKELYEWCAENISKSTYEAEERENPNAWDKVSGAMFDGTLASYRDQIDIGLAATPVPEPESGGIAED